MNAAPVLVALLGIVLSVVSPPEIIEVGVGVRDTTGVGLADWMVLHSEGWAGIE
jgi:hypothetical protein